jgi:D-alanyl-D-alanine carboxypeptidase (penicillin-binding protein 5/6)
VLALVAVLAVTGDLVLALRHDSARRAYLAPTGWPNEGQAAYQLGKADPVASPSERPVPIASVAKVMTAYLTVDGGSLDDAFLTVTPRDVVDTARRRANDESVVPVVVGERLTRRQALQALLLPSANNIAVMIARRVSGSVRGFVASMNRAARAMGMRDTHYTDPSGLDAATVSTASDQLRLAQAAMKKDELVEIVGSPWADLPVAGRVQNTDTLLGKAGFVGIKTGSHDAAGGCFMFRTYRLVDGNVTILTGVVLGQRGDNLIKAGLDAARQLADRVAPHVGHA